MQDYNVIIKDQQVLVPIDSELFKELLNLAIYAKKQLKINDTNWSHSPEVYEEMLNNHKKMMQQAIHLPKGNQIISI
jgi:hypothetical protein